MIPETLVSAVKALKPALLEVINEKADARKAEQESLVDVVEYMGIDDELHRVPLETWQSADNGWAMIFLTNFYQYTQPKTRWNSRRNEQEFVHVEHYRSEPPEQWG